MYMCVYVYICVCVCVYIYIHMHMFLHKCECVCLTLWMFFTLGAASSLSFFIAVMGVSLKYGGSLSTISTTMMPRDQMST